MLLFSTLRELLFTKKEDTCLCMVVSEQEGAEIWVDDKPTGLVTPKLIAIPRDKAVKITLKLKAHEDHNASVRSPHNLSYYYCQLQRIPLRLVNNEIHQVTIL